MLQAAVRETPDIETASEAYSRRFAGAAGRYLLGEQEAAVAEGGLTSTGQLMGTIDYMAPEQGVDTHKVDIRADVYSLGATLFALLAGKPPFDIDQKRSPVQKLVAITMGQAPSIKGRRDDLPDGLAAVIDKMLSKGREDRFATPGEVADALAPFAQDHNLAALARRAEEDGHPILATELREWKSPC